MNPYINTPQMNNVINNILVPVELTSAYLPVIRQAAELAKQHGARIHLLHMADISSYRQRSFPWLVSPDNFQQAVKGRSALLDTWKRWLETEYRIKVTATVDWDKWDRGIIRNAKAVNADLVVLQADKNKRRWYQFWQTPVENIIEKSPCQVMTFFSDKKTIAEWKHIVIPVTDFVPEARISTILAIAQLFSFKIHLVTVSDGGVEDHSKEYFFLTEALKRLKPAVDVKVECRVLAFGSSVVASFMGYARQVGADILMTNMSVVDPQRRSVEEMNLFTDY